MESSRHIVIYRLTRLAGITLFVAAAGGLFGPEPTARAQTPNRLVGLGDSIGEGVQSADANRQTQPATYLSWIARKMGVAFPLPLIQTGPLGAVGSTEFRSRLDVRVEGLNLAVSGADTEDLLRDRADAQSPAEIDSELDLVLFPRQGSQIEIAEQLNPELVVCWIGNNDALQAATSWDKLDGSQLTSEADFARDFNELADRLGRMNSRVAFANIPNVTDIAFLLDSEDLKRFTGSDFGLPPDHRTSLVVMLLIRLGLNDGSILQDPDFVLDPSEAAIVEQRIGVFNDIIAARATDIGAAVLDVNRIFDSLANDPIKILGVPIERRFLGGLFSLDAVHPSNITHAILADQMIAVLNAHHGLGIRRLSRIDFFRTFLTDPHIDKDSDLQVRGRPFAGALETVSLTLGFSGDLNDFNGIVTPNSATTSAIPGTSKLARRRAWTRERVVQAFKNAVTPH